MSRRSKEYALLCAIFFASVILLVTYNLGVDQTIRRATRILAFLSEQMVTIIFVMLMVSVAVWILRLHFSSDEEYRKFNLKKLITNENGEPDSKKIAYWSTFVAGLYAFMYLLVHNASVFVPFATFFIGLVFTHQIARTVTEGPVKHNTEVG